MNTDPVPESAVAGAPSCAPTLEADHTNPKGNLSTYPAAEKVR